MNLRETKILVVDSDNQHCQALEDSLEEQVSLVFQDNLESWLGKVDDQIFDVILLDMDQGKNLDHQLMNKIKMSTESKKEPLVFLMIDGLDINHALTDLSLNFIDDVFVKPLNHSELIDRLKTRLDDTEVRLAYNPKLIHSFTLTARDILEFYVQQPLHIGQPELSKELGTKKDVTGVISFIGSNVKGKMSIDIDKAFFDRMSANFFVDDQLNSQESLIFDFAGELCNQILGRFKLKMASTGQPIETSLPKFFVNENVPVFSDCRRDILEVPLSTREFECLLRFNMF